MTIIAVQLHNGRYRIGKKIVTYRRAQLIAHNRGARFLRIVGEGSGNLVDYIDVT